MKSKPLVMDHFLRFTYRIYLILNSLIILRSLPDYLQQEKRLRFHL